MEVEVVKAESEELESNVLPVANIPTTSSGTINRSIILLQFKKGPRVTRSRPFIPSLELIIVVDLFFLLRYLVVQKSL